MENLVDLALQMGFANAALVDTKEIPFEPAFRICCEDNACGKYGVNYSCPPACGTTDEMAEKLRAYPQALVLQTM